MIIRQRLFRGGWALLAAVGFVVGLPGCTPAPSKPTASAPALDIEQTRANDAARSLMRAIARERELIAAGNRDAADAVRDVVMQRLVDREHLAELNDKVMSVYAKKPTERELEDAVRNSVDGWSALVGYYASTAKLDFAELESPQTGNLARIVIPTGRPESPTPIRVTCVQGSDQLWRVLTVDFATKSGVPRLSHPAKTAVSASGSAIHILPPTSAPASAPASAPTGAHVSRPVSPTGLAASMPTNQ